MANGIPPLVVGALLVAAVFVISGAQLGAVEAPPVGVTVTEGVCPDTGLVDIRVAAFNDEDPNKAQVASTASVFLAGQDNPVETITTATSGLASSATDIACGTDYFVVFAHTNESSFYEEWVEGLNSGNSATNTHQYAVKQVGSLAITASNETTQGVSSPIQLTLGSGEDNSDTILKLKENTVDAWFGEGESLVCFDYDTGNYTSVEVVEGTETTVPTLASANEKCWTVSTPGLVDFGSHEFTVFIDTKDSVDPGQAANITVNVYDYQDFEYLGERFWTVEDPADNSAIGATDASYTLSIN